MKKIFLSIVAVGFGVSVAFAQTAPAENQQTETQEQTTEGFAQDEQNGNKIELTALPRGARNAFFQGPYATMKVLAIYESAAEDASEAKTYEFELAHPQEEQASGTTEIEGVEIEQVSERQPDMLLQIDEDGKVLKEENLNEPDEEELH